jgi:hypothetical protein
MGLAPGQPAAAAAPGGLAESPFCTAAGIHKLDLAMAHGGPGSAWL